MNDEIKSAARVLDMLELFATRCDGLTLSEVARGLTLPKSSTLGLLRTLHKRGYLVREGDTDAYRLNDVVRRDGFARHGRILRVAPPIMADLAAETGETVLLGMDDAPGLVRLIAKHSSPSDIRYDIELPRKVPAWCTAIGQVLLSRLEDAALRTALAGVPFDLITPSRQVDRASVTARITATRQDGIAIVEDEMAVGATGIAVLIPMAPGRPVAALELACLTQRYRQNSERLIAALRHAATAIATAMDNSEPTP